MPQINHVHPTLQGAILRQDALRTPSPDSAPPSSSAFTSCSAVNVGEPERRRLSLAVRCSPCREVKCCWTAPQPCSCSSSRIGRASAPRGGETG